MNRLGVVLSSCAMIALPAALAAQRGDSTTTLSCTIPINKDRERAYYDVLVDDVGAALPADWTATPPNPFGGNLPSAGYRSTSGAHGEIWLTETQDGRYELNCQLVSAPIRR